MTNEEVNALIEMFMRGNMYWRSNETEALSMRFEFYDADGDRVPVEGDAPTVEALNKKVYADDFNAVNVNLQALKEIVEQQANIINQQREEIMGLKSWFEKLFSSKNNDEVDSLKRRIESLTATGSTVSSATSNMRSTGSTVSSTISNMRSTDSTIGSESSVVGSMKIRRSSAISIAASENCAAPSPIFNPISMLGIN